MLTTPRAWFGLAIVYISGASAMEEPGYRSDTKELWKRVVPLVVGVVALLAIPRAAMMALMTPMMFDAPETISKTGPYIMLAVLLAKPVMLFSTVVLSFLVFKDFSQRRFAGLLVVPALWWAIYWVSLVVVA
ncbi:hypothetical protein [Sphingomonas aerolata]|jgi:hypothetical protein|uniref:hypothetical protein n=1 Tax=Sphingomonas aerolata TaxID=185951 RepID=UPI002FDF21D1